MFSALKDKLKSALSVFSKKTEEVAEKKFEVLAEKEIVKEVVKPAQKEKGSEILVKKVEERKADDKKSSKKDVSQSQKKGKKGKINQKQNKKVQKEVKNLKKVVDETVSKVIVEEKIVPVVKEDVVLLPEENAAPVSEIKDAVAMKVNVPAEEKRGFLGKIKNVFSKKEEIKPDIVVDQKKEIEQETKEDVVDEVKVEREELKEEYSEKKGFFSKVKESFTTRTISAGKFEDLFWDLELVLLESNVSVEVIEKIKVDLKKELVDKPLPFDVNARILETLKKTLAEILSVERIDLVQSVKLKEKKPYVIAFFGINGAGKTTSIAKLTYYLQQQGLSVVLAACDTFRAAAIQQLEEHAIKLNVKMIKQDYGSDAAAVAFDAIKYAEKNRVDVVLIDTAGRLHSNTNLMAELDKIIRVTKPDLKIFVGESITGNDCIEQAKQFSNLVRLDGVILTKADVDEKGGAPLSIAYTIKKPILFLGMGQEYKDLEQFDAAIILGRLGL